MGAQIQPGLVGEVQLRVTEAQTARHLGSGGLLVLATPEMIRLMEQAAVAAVDPLLPPGQQTVGVHVDVQHLAATPVGLCVTARAELIQVDDRRLTFRVEAHDDVERIGEGLHTRVVINVERFLARLQAKRP